ncbi:hypothetical protein TWF696_002709 [Orbilia brochopaga]|uniref:Uncharacterized protein n=1 Tax=Orbilia brochopaga TaxID=3140254 RepID=A0AAV9U2P7_9PEZI
MIFAKATVLIALSTVVCATPTGNVKSEIKGRDSEPPASAYSFLALRSASPIHFGSLEASGLKIWIGKETSSYCPNPPEQCPPGNTTAFLISKDSSYTAAMDVAVPGGQQVYVDPSGALSYTQAHSASIPTGSFTVGFFLSNPDDTENHLAYFTHCEGGFVACPIAPGQGPWQVFVQFTKGGLKDENVPSGNATDCLGFSAATAGAPQDGPAAWQYT